MADIHKFRTNEAVNIEAAANWDVQTRLTISSQAHVYSNVTGVHQIGVYSDSDVKFRFDTETLILLVLIMTLFYLLRQ